MNNKGHIVSSTCISVNGFYRGIIVDLGRNIFEYIPNTLTEFLNALRFKSLNDIYEETPFEIKKVVAEYINFCISQEYVLEIPLEIDKKLFPKLNLKFQTPNIITNVCIEVGDINNLNFSNIALSIKLIKCYNIQLILKEKVNLSLLNKFLLEISKIGLQSIELIVKYDKDYDFTNLIMEHRNISFIFLYSAIKTEVIKSHYFGVQKIFSSTKDLNPVFKRTINDFNVNITLFTEAQKHNTYFNRKLHIGVNGEIKNAQENTEVFGNINSLNSPNELLNIISKKEFQKYWYVHKDLIDVCKQCEYRYMCVDNRVPLKRNEREWYMEMECNYNPYIAKWNDEKGYKTLEDCGIESNISGFKINKKKLNAINKELWGDD